MRFLQMRSGPFENLSSKVPCSVLEKFLFVCLYTCEYQNGNLGVSVHSYGSMELIFFPLEYIIII